MEIARDREVARIQTNLADLAAQNQEPAHPERGLSLSKAAVGTQSTGGLRPDCPYDPEIHTKDYPEYWETKRRTRERLTRARRMYLFLIHEDPAKRAAWETLVGPVDWERAQRFEPQDDEPFFDPQYPEDGTPNMREPDMLLTAEAGLLAEVTGGPDALAEIRNFVEQSAEGKPIDV